MNEQLQSKLVEILTQMQSAVKATGTFVLDQLPDIAQQYVIYGRTQSTFFVLLCAAIVALSIFLFTRGVKRDEGDLAIVSFVAFIPSAAGFFFNISGFFLVWVAPKVWLIKEIAQLIK